MSINKHGLLVFILLLSGIYNSALSFTESGQYSFQQVSEDSVALPQHGVVYTYIDDSGREVEVVQIPGVLPGVYKTPVAQPSESSVILPDVPAYDWSFGCSATAGAMMAGYYDNNGYPDMYTGPTNGGVAPMNNSIWGQAIINGEVRKLCPLSATRLNLDGRPTPGHVDDYWIQYGSNEPDPFIGNWPEHSWEDCTGDFMKTNQSTYNNSDGATTFYFYGNGSPFSPNITADGLYGLRLFFESRGAEVTDYFNQYIQGFNGNSLGFTFEQFKQQIDNGSPVIIQLFGHSVLGLGYDDNGQKIYLHDTWDYSLKEMTWGGVYANMQHYGVAVIQLAPPSVYPTLFVDPMLAEVSWESGSVNFSVVSNTGWEVSDNADWLSINPANGNGNGVFSAFYTANTIPSQRSAEITVSTSDKSENKLSEIITLIQQGCPLSTQNIYLNEGWSGISSYLDPINPQVEDLLAPIQDQLIILQDIEGNVYQPSVQNTILNWDTEKGYFIKLNSPANITITGTEPLNNQLSLQEGWNLIPATNSETISITSFFGVHIGKIEIVTEIAGLKVFWPEKEIGTLQALTPGKAYLVKAKQSFILF